MIFYTIRVSKLSRNPLKNAKNSSLPRESYGAPDFQSLHSFQVTRQYILKFCGCYPGLLDTNGYGSVTRDVMMSRKFNCNQAGAYSYSAPASGK